MCNNGSTVARFSLRFISPRSLNHVFRESDITKERILKILSTGANVVLISGGIDDLCLKYFVEAGAMAVRRCKKEDLKRIARATGGQYVLYKCTNHKNLLKRKIRTF